MYHVTTKYNLRSIMRGGLCPAFARTARAAVWLCSESRLLWALAHVAERHGVLLSDVRILRVNSRDLKLQGTAWAGILVSPKRIPPSRLTAMILTWKLIPLRLRKPKRLARKP